MDGNTCSSLFPLHRCKTLHLVRHAQGVHNVEGEKDHKAYMSHELFDARLTPLGWSQVDNLRKHVNACGLAKKIELVITSPLLRTMQTAVGVFGGESLLDGSSVPPLMVENAGNSGHLAISSSNCPPFIAVELCREHLGVHPCDKRRSIREYESLFPAIDFSLIENNEDVLWKADVREPNSEVAARGSKFIDWLWSRKEKEIAIVTHSGFLFHTLQQFGNGCHPSVKDEISKQYRSVSDRAMPNRICISRIGSVLVDTLNHAPDIAKQHLYASEFASSFANCELRSMVLIDKSVIGSDPPTTNYPGKIPQGSDLPSDVASEKHPEENCTSN